MPEIALHALVTVVLLVGLGVYGEGGRLGWRWALVPLVIGLLGGGLLGVLVLPGDLWGLPRDTGLGWDVATLIAGALFGALGRGAVGALPGPPLLVAPLLGALVGEVPAAAILTAGVHDGRARARLAMGAMAGGFLGRIGDPALLLFGGRDPHLAWKLLPLGLLAAVLGMPRAGDRAAAGPVDRSGLAILVGVALGALVPGGALPALIVGALVLAVRQRGRLRAVDLGPVAWALTAGALVLVAVAGGGPGLLAFGFEQTHFLAGRYVAPAITAIGAVASFVGGGPGASLFGLAVFDRAVGAAGYDPAFAAAAGVAAGGLGPLLAADALKSGWWRQFLLVLGAVAWVHFAGPYLR